MLARDWKLSYPTVSTLEELKVFGFQGEYGFKSETSTNWWKSTIRSGGCGLFEINMWKLTSSRYSNDWQIDSSTNLTISHECSWLIMLQWVMLTSVLESKILLCTAYKWLMLIRWVLHDNRHKIEVAYLGIPQLGDLW